MPTSIHKRVRQANAGENPNAIFKLQSGWVFAAETQTLDGYCLLLSDPVVSDLNSLSEADRSQYCLDMIRIGDALLKATDAYRINYETWCNLDPALHTHIVPRYMSEAPEKRILPAILAYDTRSARPFDPSSARDALFIQKMRRALSQISEKK